MDKDSTRKDRDTMPVETDQGMRRLVLGIPVLLLVMVNGMGGLAAAADQGPPPYVEAAQQLTTAYERLISALAEASLSLEPRKDHKDQKMWTERHMRHVRDLLNESPAIGPLLERTRVLVEAHPAFPLAGKAITNALANLDQAVGQVGQSIEAKSEDQVMAHARLATGMLSAAIGRPDSNFPTTGALSYAMAIVNQWTIPVIPPYLPNVPNE